MKLHTVAARAGWTWVKQGIRTFVRQPLAMTGLFFLFMGLATALSFVPVVGTLMALVLLPAATLGLMAATRQAADGRFPMPSVLATALRSGAPQRLAMIKLGALYVVGLLLVMAATALVDGGTFAHVYLTGEPLTDDTVSNSAFQNAVWVGMALHTPLALVFWHAPALVHWHAIDPIKSLFFSAMACWRNKGAMLVFGLCWLGLFMASALLVSVLATLLGGPSLAKALVLPSVVVLASMFFTSLWFSFQDCFSDDLPSSPPNA